MKKCYSLRLALLITGCAQQTFTFNKPAAVAPKYHPSFLRFWNWAEENCLRCNQNLWRRRENVVRKRPANIRKWIARVFITLGIYTPLEARVYCSQ